MPRARKVYVLRPDGGVPVVFIAHPHILGVWIRTDASVLLADCEACQAVKGEPCKAKGLHRGATHYLRRDDARRTGKVDSLESIAAIVVRTPKR